MAATVEHWTPKDASESLEAALFGRSECARCHVDAGKGQDGEDLFNSICWMCHKSLRAYARSEALATLDRRTLRAWIADGKGTEGMPGYSAAMRGPLTDEQIDSLVEALVAAR